MLYVITADSFSAATFDWIKLQVWFTSQWKAKKLILNQTDVHFCSRATHFSTILDQSNVFYTVYNPGRKDIIFQKRTLSN